MLPILLLAALASAEDPAPPDQGTPPSPSGPTEPPPAPSPSGPTVPPETPAPSTPAGEPAPVLQQEAPPTTVLFPIRAANLGATEVRAAEILFRRRYEAAIGRTTIDEQHSLAAVAGTDDQGLFAACQLLGCTKWITVDLVRLDKEVFVTVIERDQAGAVLQRIETQSPSLDGLAAVFDRVARALAAGVPLDKVPAARAAAPSTTSASTSSSTSEPARVPSRPSRGEKVIGFKFGIHGPLWPDFQVALSHAFTYRRESKDRFFEINAGFTVPLGLSDQRGWGMVFGEVGLFHVFSSASPIAFYAGGGFGPRVGGYDNIGVGGGVYGETGLMFGRQSSSRTYVQLKVGGDAFTGYPEPYVISYAGLEAGVGF